MKKIKMILFLFCISILGIGTVRAANISVKANASTVVVGNNVKVTVSVGNVGKNSGNVGAWEYCVSYDSSKLTLVSPASPCVNDGVVGLTSETTVFTFKAKTSGKSNVTIGNAALYDFVTEAQMGVSKGSVSITAKTQAEIEASYSTNADLKELYVEGYEISPAYSKDTLEYSVTVPNEVEEVVIQGTKADNRASLKGTGKVSLTEGSNRFEIVVTAEKGNTKKYILSIMREELNPIQVHVNGKEYTVVRKIDAMETPQYYDTTTVGINDTEVPAFISEITGFTLVGLKDEESNIALYIYKEGTYTLYEQVIVGGSVFIPLKYTEKLTGYDKSKNITIGDISVEAFYQEEDTFVLVYGMNAATGNTGWYVFDTQENTFQRYNGDALTKLQQDVKDYLFFVIVFGSGLGLSIIALIVLLVSHSKVKRKNKKMLLLLQNVAKPKDEEREEKVVEKQVKKERVQEEAEEKEVVLTERERRKKEQVERDKAAKEFLSDDTVEQSVFDNYQEKTKRTSRRKK